MLGILLFLNLSTPEKRLEVTSLGGLKLGDIAPEDVIAPYTFFITKTQNELETEQESVSSSVLLVLETHEGKKEEILNSVNKFYNEIEKIQKRKGTLEEKIKMVQSLKKGLSALTVTRLLWESNRKFFQTLQDKLTFVLDKGVMRDKKAFKLKWKGVTIRRGGSESPKLIGEVLDRSDALLKIREEGARVFQGDREWVESLVEVASLFLEENLYYDEEETRKRQVMAREQVSKTKGTVLKGEMIVRAHDPVTQEVIDKLRSLREEATGGGDQDSERKKRFLIGLGRNASFLIFLFFFGLFLARAKPEEFARFRILLLLAIVSCGVIGISNLILYFSPFGGTEEIPISGETYLYLIPLPFAATLIAILLGQEIGVALTFLLFLVIGLNTDLRFSGLLVALTGGLAGAASVKGLTHRSQFYRSFLLIASTQTLTILSLDALRMKSLVSIRTDLFFGILNGFFSTMLIIGLLPFFERIFKITTNLTLLELSDMNRPLLRQLAVEAPGTYHHSLVLGSLAEAAAKSIGANPLLARVSAYYHDIGKMKKPLYFIENQGGIKNPHDGLSPEMSCLVVSSHIKEGVEMAKEAGIPSRIIDVIREHQGTTLMRYFYEKAKKKNSGDPLDEARFRYPGPKPSTPESAIIMLADSLEATCRSLDNPTPTRLREVIQETINLRLQDGQLDSCNLTLSQLKKIGNAFFPVLVGIFHPRIEYPSESKSRNTVTSPQTLSTREE